MRRADLSFRGVLPCVCVCVCDLETSTMKRPGPDLACSTTEKGEGGWDGVGGYGNLIPTPKHIGCNTIIYIPLLATCLTSVMS